ncbi:MAG: hypothetical protein ACRDND_21150 [Streptosporangiaceae bacterium]
MADAPRCIEWWAGQSARIVPLEVDLDPESAEFYDYTTTDWYREPERTGAPTLAGLGYTAVLASAHGRVIASTSASLPPGAALPRQPQAAGFVPLAGPGQPPGLLPWTVLALPARDQRHVVPVKARPAG